ncbi:MAG: 2-aminoethylphosphonate--pyruvate transaminase [Chitinophagales bacterium]|nr:2-aminoethylphosphonate--pyruvate transaminase [Chitinophagales bacterium]
MESTITKDKLLFTPGPLTTSMGVKKAMLHDLGSRGIAFIDAVKQVRSKLLHMAETSQETGYEAIIMQGSGTFGVESMITSGIAKDGHLLVIINGAYGDRIAKIADVNGIKKTVLKYSENQWPSLQEVENTLSSDATISHVIIVHCETTSGIFNPIKETGALAKKYGKTYMVDAMSSFGAVPVNVADCQIDFLVSSSNKCIEGVPGFSFCIAKRDALMKTKGQSRTLSLDMFAQWEGLEQNGQFRFTPPTHAILAFHQAIVEHEAEGGVQGRAARYQHNYNTLMAGMRKMGFKEYLEPEKQGYIISSFLYPEHPNFDFNTFYRLLNDKDFVIYPGKLSQANAFRIGNIGQIFEQDILNLLEAIQQTIDEMGVSL